MKRAVVYGLDHMTGKSTSTASESKNQKDYSSVFVKYPSLPNIEQGYNKVTGNIAKTKQASIIEGNDEREYEESKAYILNFKDELRLMQNKRNSRKGTHLTSTDSPKELLANNSVLFTQHQIKNQVSSKLLVSSSLNSLKDFRNPFSQLGT